MKSWSISFDTATVFLATTSGHNRQNKKLESNWQQEWQKTEWGKGSTTAWSSISTQDFSRLSAGRVGFVTIGLAET